MMRVNKQSISEILKSPQLLRKAVVCPPPSAMKSQAGPSMSLPEATDATSTDRPSAAPTPSMPENPPAGPDEALLQRVIDDIGRCVQADTCYSPLSDLAKQAAGLEHEMLLEKQLSEIGVPFWTETDLRAHGFFKTPDIWLQV